MTRRERLERKLEKRAEWAEKAETRSAALIKEGMQYFHDMNGQPILVGHYSEKRHRRAIARAEGKLRKGSEYYNLAKHHRSKADGLATQLDRSIFSDDPDAIESLKRKIASLTAQRDEMKRANAYWRKHKTMKGYPGISDDAAARLDAEIPTRYSWERQPFPKWQLSNLGATIRNAEKRIEEIRARQARSEAAQASGGVLIEGDEWVRVTFAEKPERAILEALKAAGFRWGGGSWVGRRDKLPESLGTGADV